MDNLLFLLRHGQSIKNKYNEFGSTNSNDALTAIGETEIKIALNSIKTISPQINEKNCVIYTSTEERAIQSSKVLSNDLSCEIKTSELLNPINTGDIKGLNESEVMVKYPLFYNQLKQYRENKLSGYEITQINGETIRDFQKRIITGFNFFHNKETKQYQICVGHASSLTALINYFKKNDLNNLYSFYEISLGHLYVAAFANNEWSFIHSNIIYP